MKEKYRMTFSDGTGHTADLELCCICNKLLDLKHPEKCIHYSDDYDDNACLCFEQVDDVEKRIRKVLDCRCGETAN